MEELAHRGADDGFAVLAVFAGQTVTTQNIVGGTAAVDSNDFIVYDAATGSSLSYDPDGNGAALSQQFAVIENRPALTAADFFVV